MLVDPNSIELPEGTELISFEPETNEINVQSNREYVKVCYRVQSPYLDEPLWQRDPATYDVVGDPANRNFNSRSNTLDEELISTPDLYKYGSITRGITVGNRQSLFVNSALNLQLSGALADNLFIEAAITDQNVPFQPEGNTQQIRDFDNVLIRIYNDKWDLQAGDLVQQNDDRNYFLRYYKNQQGFRLSRTSKLSKKTTLKSQISISAAEGKFASTSVEPIEGVQGPYKLRGPDGERFIIVLANSERVFIDGVLMKRGFDQDYIIDYNIGEIMFNPNIQITRFTRIRVDFEYARQSFPRSSIQTSHTLQSNRLLVYTDYYRESDNETNPLLGSFSADDFQAFQTLGDEVENALISGADSVRFDLERILYARRDTMLAGFGEQVYYERSTDPREAFYSVSFTEVGQGNGDYVLGNSTINGREFEWIPPLTDGTRRGNFAPIVRIVTPNHKQMAVVGSEIDIGRGLYFNQETAISNQDQNLLSGLDDADNTSGAWKGAFGIRNRRISLLNDYLFSSELSFEYNASHFKPIDRFRSIDFDRDWNYLFPLDSADAPEKIISADLGITKNARNTINYNYVNRQRLGVLSGWQQYLTLRKDLGPTFIRTNTFLMDNRVLRLESDWLRSMNEIGVRINPVEFGYYYDLDQNTLTDPDSGEILSSAMYYNEKGLFIRNADSASFQLGLRAGIREDKMPVEGEIEAFTRTEKLNATTSKNWDNHQLKLAANIFQIEDKLSDTEDQRIAGSITSINALFQNSFRSNLMYSTSSARELRREYVYTAVGAGQGTHTWRDENGDGVQSLDEFYEAINQDERNYAKILVPTDEYVEAFQTIYRHGMDLNFPSDWKNRNLALAALERISFQTNWNINFKTTSDKPENRLLPFNLNSDTSIVNSRSISRYTLFINRNREGVSFLVNRQFRNLKQLNQNGFELTDQSFWNPQVRLNIGKVYQLDGSYQTGNHRSSSDFLNGRNFLINENLYSGSFTWLFSVDKRITLNYSRNQKSNDLTEASSEFSIADEYGVELNWIKAGSGNFNGNFRFIQIDFEGEKDSYLGYTLLQALQPGNNITLNLNYQQNLKKGLQLTLQYFGRKSESTPIIHTGTMQVTAFF